MMRNKVSLLTIALKKVMSDIHPSMKLLLPREMKLAIGNSQGHHHQHVRVLTISLKRTFLHLVKYPLSLVLHQITPSLCQRTEIGAISSGSTSKMSLTKRRKTIKANYFQAPQMQHALGSALSSLPGETLVYCGHEYSLQV